MTSSSSDQSAWLHPACPPQPRRFSHFEKMPVPGAARRSFMRARVPTVPFAINWKTTVIFSHPISRTSVPVRMRMGLSDPSSSRARKSPRALGCECSPKSQVIRWLALCSPKPVNP